MCSLVHSLISLLFWKFTTNPYKSVDVRVATGFGTAACPTSVFRGVHTLSYWIVLTRCIFPIYKWGHGGLESPGPLSKFSRVGRRSTECWNYVCDPKFVFFRVLCCWRFVSTHGLPRASAVFISPSWLPSSMPSEQQFVGKCPVKCARKKTW